MIKLREKIKAYFDLLRGFTLFAPFIGILAGALIAMSVLGMKLNPELLLKIIFAGFLAALLNGASNALNQYFDIEIDRINKPKRPLILGKISKKQTIAIAVFLYSFIVFVSPFLSSNPIETFSLFLSASILTIIYSMPPIRTKRLTWGSNLTIALARGVLLIVAGWSLVGSIINLEPWILGIIFGTFIFFAASTKDLGDVGGDKQFNIKTLPVVFGAKFTNKFISLGFIIPPLMLYFFSFLGFLKANQLFVSFLSIMLLIWGLFICHFLNKTLLSNDRLWRQMYYVMMLFQIGLVLIYYLSYKYV